MDLRLESMSGPDAIRAIRREAPDARIIALTMYQGDEDIHQALAAGAATYLLKNSLSDDLIGVVRQVHAGERPLPPAVKARLDERARLFSLTPREIEVLSLIAQGNRNKEVADLLGISITTVPGHLRKVLSETGSEREDSRRQGCGSTRDYSFGLIARDAQLSGASAWPDG